MGGHHRSLASRFFFSQEMGIVGYDGFTCAVLTYDSGISKPFLFRLNPGYFMFQKIVSEDVVITSDLVHKFLCHWGHPSWIIEVTGCWMIFQPFVV